VFGETACPMVVADEHGGTVLIEAPDNRSAEWLARGVTVRMGGSAHIAEYPMSGAAVKRSVVPNTLTLAMQIGRTLREAREAHRDPIAALLALLPNTFYSYGRVIFRGKIVDVRRETRAGFSIGTVRIDADGGWRGAMEITIQNENLLARVDGRVQAIVPDLICIMESETAEPITTEMLRYGQRVVVLAVAVPAIMRSPEALALFGPACFGLEEIFTPIEQIPDFAGPA
jgi:uncharacterized protein